MTCLGNLTEGFMQCSIQFYTLNFDIYYMISMIFCSVLQYKVWNYIIR